MTNPMMSSIGQVNHSLSATSFSPMFRFRSCNTSANAVHENTGSKEGHPEARTLRNARSGLRDHCENYGGNQVRHESCDQSIGITFFLIFTRMEYDPGTCRPSF